MSAPPKQPCTSPGCPNRVPHGRCDTHNRHARRQRATWTDLYGPDWPRVRIEYLERNPACALCGHLATTPDHYPVGIRELRARRITNPHHDRYLRPLCGPCHSKHTGRTSPGGWNARGR